MIRYFISTGCSFTEVPIVSIHNKTSVNLKEFESISLAWPVHVTNHLNCLPKYKGKTASGNGIISKTTIYETIKALEIFKPEEILVGIMWSGAYRQEIYSTDIKYQYNHFPREINDSSNPVSIAGSYNYYKVMPYWEDELSKIYYKHIYDDIGAYISTIENILRTQWFLKLHNIKYFMSQYLYLTLPTTDEVLNHPDVKYLYNEIDFDNWLPVKSEWDWCASFQDPSTWDDGRDVIKHPHTIQHKAFADQVIIPFLKSKGWIT